MKYRYCYHCGSRTIGKQIDGKLRDFCKKCQLPLYENPIPSVAVVVANQQGELLLVRRSVEPGIGEWCLPGGFIEVGETPQEAAVRELKEELGIDIQNPRLLDVGSHLNGYYGDVLIIGFTLQIDEKLKIIPGDDVSEAVYFSIENRPDLVFRVHEDFLNTWLANRKNNE